MALIRPTTGSAPLWFRTRGGPSSARVRLVCFPHLGAGASVYARWQDLLGPGVEVAAAEPPGHEARMSEPPWTSLPALADAAAEELDRAGGPPLVLYGHSLGAYLAYECAVRLEHSGGGPLHLVVSGAVAPRHARAGLPADADPVEWVTRLGGMPPELLAQPELLDLFTPAIRADFTALAGYHPSTAALPCPITALHGAQDHSVRPELLRDWAELTSATFTSHTFPGGHFFPFPPPGSPHLVTEHLARLLARTAAR